MTYTRGVPQATDRISDTQAPIQTNFNLLDSDLGVDHYQPTAATNGQQSSPGSNVGYHRTVTLPQRASAPTPPSSTGVGVEYGAQTSVTGGSVTFPYWVQGTTSPDYPMTPVKSFLIIDFTNLSMGNPAVLTNSLNVATCVASIDFVVPSSGKVTSFGYTVTFDQKVPYTGGSNEYLAIGSIDNGSGASSLWAYSISSVSDTKFTITFTLSVGSGTFPDRVQIIVYQY